jgi:hypothetical protein
MHEGYNLLSVKKVCLLSSQYEENSYGDYDRTTNQDDFKAIITNRQGWLDSFNQPHHETKC